MRPTNLLIICDNNNNFKIMLIALKLIWKRIPKKIVATIVIIPASYAANRFFDYLFFDKPLLALSKIYEPLIWIAGGLIIYFIVFFILSSLREISELHKKEPQKSIAEIDKAIDKSKKKEIPSRFELQSLNYDPFEVKVFVTRKWRPNSYPPGVEDFIRKLDFSHVYCGKCKCDFFVEYGQHTRRYTCTNSDCENDPRYTEGDLLMISQKIEADFKGELRRNFEKYWGKYKKLYLDFTKNKPEEFEEPLR